MLLSNGSWWHYSLMWHLFGRCRPLGWWFVHLTTSVWRRILDVEATSDTIPSIISWWVVCGDVDTIYQLFWAVLFPLGWWYVHLTTGATSDTIPCIISVCLVVWWGYYLPIVLGGTIQRARLLLSNSNHVETTLHLFGRCRRYPPSSVVNYCVFHICW